MNSPPDQVKTRLCRYFTRTPEVDFAYLYSPLQGTGESSLTDYDIAVAFNTHLTLPKIFEAQIDAFNSLRRVLGSDRIALVVINECPFEYQRLIHRTGTLVFERDAKAHEMFCSRIRKKHRLIFS
ncbi:hypothetical protein JW992_05350 [candidate division KSB1 bacterium]|nr:hypothetical protein [candidate division KSB1 bacterium]